MNSWCCDLLVPGHCLQLTPAHRIFMLLFMLTKPAYIPFSSIGARIEFMFTKKSKGWICEDFHEILFLSIL